jgi:hypothetical protein
MAKERRAVMSPLEDLFRTRTNRDRLGTIPTESDHVLLMRDLDRLRPRSHQTDAEYP